MSTFMNVNPFRCRVWESHCRMDEYVTEDSCKDEICTMKGQGQLVPAIGRLIHNDSMHDVEIICGSRRLFAARHLNIELTVEIRDVVDREAAITLEIENRQRRDLSAYERGKGFARWLSAGYFESQEDLARSLKMSCSQVSRLIKLTKLPSVVVGAFRDPADICEAWGLDLHVACQNAKMRATLLSRARALALNPERLPGQAVYAKLMHGSHLATRRLRNRHEVIVGRGGRPLFRIRHHSQAVALVIDRQRISEESLGMIKDAISAILQNGIAQEPAAVGVSPDRALERHASTHKLMSV